MRRSLRQLLKRLADHQVVGIAEWLLQPAKRSSWGGPFNGQAERLHFFEELLREFRPQVILETGTFRGTTTEYMARVSGLPVWSVEKSARHHGFARVALRDQPRVNLKRGDSREYLRSLLGPSGWRDSRCFVYLDAHWGEHLPLAAELGSILSAPLTAVIAIDDFEVPGDPGYGFDDYGPSGRLAEPLISGLLSEHSAKLYYPTAPSSADTGAKRGMCVIGSGLDACASLDRMTTIQAAAQPREEAGSVIAAAEANR